MSHRIFLNSDGFLEQEYKGNLTQEIVDKAIKDTMRTIKVMQKDGKPLLLLVNCTELGRINTPSRKASVEALRDIAYDKLAVYGSSPIAKAMSNLIIHASGKQRKIRLFNTRDAAIAWLKD